MKIQLINKKMIDVPHLLFYTSIIFELMKTLTYVLFISFLKVFEVRTSFLVLVLGF